MCCLVSPRQSEKEGLPEQSGKKRTEERRQGRRSQVKARNTAKFAIKIKKSERIFR